MPNRQTLSHPTPAPCRTSFPAKDGGTLAAQKAATARDPPFFDSHHTRYRDPQHGGRFHSQRRKKKTRSARGEAARFWHFNFSNQALQSNSLPPRLPPPLNARKSARLTSGSNNAFTSGELGGTPRRRWVQSGGAMPGGRAAGDIRSPPTRPAPPSRPQTHKGKTTPFDHSPAQKQPGKACPKK